MIPPREQWCIQIDVTNACIRSCSNCTRLTSHVRKPFFMDLTTFERAAKALTDFPAASPPDRRRRRKVIGIIGGEPLLHPQFGELVAIMRRVVPKAKYRGLWTGLEWLNHKYADAVRQLLGGWPNPPGYLNWNPHREPCYHQPVLVAVQDVIREGKLMWELIDSCPLQEEWSATITPKGFFFCEVAGAMDAVFDGPGGLPITPGCWRHDLADYRDQIEQWCPRCGICLPLARHARRDKDEIDDVSQSNLEKLGKIGSPAIAAARCRAFDPALYDLEANMQNWRPLRYLRPGQRQ